MQSSRSNNKAGRGRRAEGSGPGCVSIVMGPPPQMVFDLQALSCFVWLAVSRESGSRCKLDMACSPNENIRSKIRRGNKKDTLLDLCVSSLRRGHANLLCVVPVLTDDLRRETKSRSARNGTCSFALPIKVLRTLLRLSKACEPPCFVYKQGRLPL